MYSIALKMLIGDRAKFLMLISALTIASLLMTQQTAVFLGLMRWTTANLRNTQAAIWVVDPKVEQLNEVKPMRDTDLARVRSVDGVKWAVPLYQSIQQARLSDGRFKSIIFVGLDSTTLIGAPPVMIQGKISDLWMSKSIIIDELGVERFSIDPKHPIGVGDSIEINDNEGRIVGICKTDRSFFGYPYVYTTYERAIEFAPKQRKNLSFVLVEPLEGENPVDLARRIEKQTGLKAYTNDEFFWSTIWWFIRNTGIPVSFGITILLGFVVGAAVCGQTFYMFILENLKYLGALKAMGASTSLITRMVLLQAFLVGFIGYGLGVGLASIFGIIALVNKQPPFYLPYSVLFITFLAILFICFLSASFGIRKIRKLEAAEVFRG